VFNKGGIMLTNSFLSPAKEGQLALVEIIHKGKREKAILPPGNHRLKEGVSTKRLIHLFPEGEPFVLVIPKKKVEEATSKIGSSLGVYYTWKAITGIDHWEKTNVFWEKRKADFVRSFLQRVKRADTGGTMKFHLVEEGRLVRYANEACRLAATEAVEATYFNIQVFGVHVGEDKETSPFDYE
jgi:hypothetical protein